MRSLNSLALFLCLASIAGCSDNSSLNGVYPSSGFLGRTMRVEISGDNVSFKQGAKVDFGPGTTVSNITVASKTSIVADVQITDAAAVGPHDVVVQSDGSDWTLTQAFEVESPLKTTFQGKLAQGSVVMFTMRNLDFVSPFDTTCGFSFFGICLQYTNIQVTTPVSY